MGDADGQWVDEGRHRKQRVPCLGPLLGSDGGQAEEKGFYISLKLHKISYKLLLGGRCGEGGRAVPASKRPHVWPGNHVTHVWPGSPFSPLLLTFNLWTCFFLCTIA